MKLTKAMREAIVLRLIERTRAARDANFRNRQHRIAIQLLRSRYGNDVFERCRELPEGWFRVYKQIRFESKFSQRLTPCIASFRYHYRERGVSVRELRSLGSVSLTEYAPLPASATDTWDAEFLDPFYDEIEAYAEDLRKHEDAVQALTTKTQGVLAAYTTVELLSKDWPEGYALLPPEMMAPILSPGVPMVRIADLNAAIEEIKKAA